MAKRGREGEAQGWEQPGQVKKVGRRVFQTAGAGADEPATQCGSNPHACTWDNWTEPYAMHGDLSADKYYSFRDRIRVDPRAGICWWEHQDRADWSAFQALHQLRQRRNELGTVDQCLEGLTRLRSQHERMIPAVLRQIAELESAPASGSAELNRRGVYEVRNAAGQWFPCTLTMDRGGGHFAVAINGRYWADVGPGNIRRAGLCDEVE
eukprot:TRINITY_DN34059_c0_g1_i1.p2 TRINITY_DN34059_c0_g1~~TRINITY_DN34059_c0_g1_i1.p2  ORF type:complete len:231 (+),score=80.69 TRINITY_DN34059_c0_g1_i1:69-695(+)